ncbi:hypothetical protein E2320_021173, partial [Naja naja]
MALPGLKDSSQRNGGRTRNIDGRRKKDMEGRKSRCNWRGLPFTFILGFILVLAPPIAQSRSLRFVTL